MSVSPETILGYTFHDANLLRQALTHPSYVNESREPGLMDYQRLEFLGDAVVSLCLADLLSQQFPGLPEGDLSRLRASLVDQPRLAELAAQIGIAPRIMLGHGEEQDGGREKPSILSDVLEAVLGAIYRDGGYEAVKGVVARLYTSLLEHQKPGAPLGDAKSQLQEWLAAQHQGVPDYSLIVEEGPAHDRRFTVAVNLEGERIATGEGRSKKAAQQAAAKAALERLQTRCAR